MKIFEICDGTLKLFGCTLLKIKYKKGKTKFYIFGLPLFEADNTFDKMRADFSGNTDFDTRKYDKKINEITSHYDNVLKCKVNNSRIAFLATKIYDMGGHTKWMRDMQKNAV